MIAAICGGPGDDEQVFAVLPDNWDTVQRFLALRTQWRLLAGFGGIAWLGLDYPAIHALFALNPPTDPATAFAELQMMEWAALPVLNERRDS